MRFCRIMLPIAFLTFLPLTAVSAQNQADIDAINQLIDRYGATEEAMDMAAQARLMREDRVWVGEGAGRRTDQAKNMSIQQAQFDLTRATVPGIRWFIEDRDRLIRFHAGGNGAVASFFRYTTYLIPPGTPPEIAEGFAAVPATVFTLVLEKAAGQWRIVHSHVSNLAPPAGAP